MEITGSGRLTINLTALQHNYRVLRQEAGGAQAAAVVKADAYGLGAAFVAPALYQAGCRLFFVAQAGEAFALANALAEALKSAAKGANTRAAAHSGAQIAILNGALPHEAEAVAKAGFLPVLNSLSAVRGWAALCRSHGRHYPAMLQCDSGMARLGLDAQEMAALRRSPALLAEMRVEALLSHLACADAEESPMNAAQKARFIADAAALAKLLPRPPKLSFAASSGLGLGAPFHMDIVRPGLALYGLAEGGARARRLSGALRPVIRLETPILRVGILRKGETAGYGATYRAPRDMPIAALAAGYADGWPRSLSNSGAAYYKGARLPIIGRVSMDCMTVDLSALAGGRLPPRGAWAELVGPHQSLRDVARDAGAIPYEILTALGRRYQRIYKSGRAGAAEPAV